MKRVLLISNQPLDATGGRAAKFRTRVDRFPNHGWEVVYFHAPDAQSLSFPRTVLRAARLARREDVDVIQSICNPPAHPLVGFAVSAVTGVPWVLEVRDPIVTNPDVEPGSFSWYARRLLEAVYVRAADRVLWIDGIQMEDGYFEETYPSLPASRWVKLPYLGYIEEMFRDADTEASDGFTVTYAGSFYEGWIEPYGFLAGLGRFVADNPDMDVTARFYGDWNDDYQRAAEGYGVADVVEIHPFVPHEEVVPVLKGSDVVLYVGGSDPRNRLSVPSKIWDYIGSRTPILAVVDPSFEVADLIESTGLGVVAPPDDPSAVADALERLHGDEFTYDPSEEVYERFTRERHLSAMADALDDVVGAE